MLCHSEKESATPTWKHTFGYHPLFCFLDNTREALSGMLREGRAGSNTTADHIAVLDDALAQIPDVHRHGTPILIRSDSAGCTHGLLAHIRGLREHGIDVRFSVGVAITEPIRQAILSAEPKKLCYRLLHVAARITRTARQTQLRIAEQWPWATDLVTAFDRLTALPRPAG